MYLIVWQPKKYFDKLVKRRRGDWRVTRSVVRIPRGPRFKMWQIPRCKDHYCQTMATLLNRGKRPRFARVYIIYISKYLPLPPYKYTSITGHCDEVLAIVGEAQTCDQLRVAKHGGHTLARVVVVHTHILVRTACGRIDATLVQNNL